MQIDAHMAPHSLVLETFIYVSCESVTTLIVFVWYLDVIACMHQSESKKLCIEMSVLVSQLWKWKYRKTTYNIHMK